MAKPLTTEALINAFTTYGTDEDLACGALLQCAAELHVVMAAMANGLAEGYTHTALLGIAQRMEVAASLSSKAKAEAAR